MRITTYKNREFYIGIYRNEKRPRAEQCDKGHWKELGKQCEMCQADSSVQQSHS